MAAFFSPLRHRAFRLLALGQLTSNVGDALFAVALPWYVLAHHGGALLLGTVLTAYGIPRTGLIAVGGAAADRFTPWRVMMAADVVRLIAVLALALTAATGPARAVLLIPTAVVLGLGDGLFLPGSLSIVSTLLPDDALQAGVALSSGGTQLATLVGPALGGVAVAVLGASVTFSLDAATFAVSVLTLIGITRARRRPRPVTDLVSSSPDRHGDAATQRPSIVALLRSSRVLQIIVLIVVAANLGSGAESEVALPALAHGPLHAGATGYGVIIAAFAGGALVGTIAAGTLPRPRRPAVIASAAFALQSGFAAAVALLPSVTTVAVALAACGALNGLGNTLTMTAMQRWAPPGLLGRLMGLIMLAGLGTFPLSVLCGGIVVHDIGPRPVFPIAAAIVAIALCAGLTQSEWRSFGETEEPAITQDRTVVR